MQAVWLYIGKGGSSNTNSRKARDRVKIKYGKVTEDMEEAEVTEIFRATIYLEDGSEFELNEVATPKSGNALRVSTIRGGQGIQVLPHASNVVLVAEEQW